MLGLLNHLWLGKATLMINTRRAAVGLSKDAASVTSVSLSRIVVIGDESAGKSSVLQRLVERKVLPFGEDIITRRPILISLRFQEESKVPRMHLKLPKKEDIETNDDAVI